MALHQVLIGGAWRNSKASGTFFAENPALSQPLADEYPVSSWADCDAALNVACGAARQLRNLPSEKLQHFLRRYADLIEENVESLVDVAHQETALPKSPRLSGAELPRTTNQLRQAADAAAAGDWSMPTIDTLNNIRSQFEPIGPVCLFGPNNFPFAFNSIAGGDFAAAIAAGNPVIAKANTSHPGTTRCLAQLAHQAAGEASLPPGSVQMIYRTGHADGERLVADPRLGATGYTGSRAAGLKLKAAADAAGKLIYLELSSVNPVVVFPGALAERFEKIAEEFMGSCLMGVGQFCTNPGLVLLLEDEHTEGFISTVSDSLAAAPVGTLLSRGVAETLQVNVAKLVSAGATLLAGGKSGGGQGYSFQNTLLRLSARDFLEDPITFQTETFGNCSLFVVATGTEQLAQIIDSLEGNLTGCIYSHTQGDDDPLYDQIAPHLRPRVGRMINDKMPTGVAVSAAMNHGGPYPSTGHPGFTAVGIPASLRRFAMLACYDGVRPGRLPPLLQDYNAKEAWRLIDGKWSTGDVSS